MINIWPWSKFDRLEKKIKCAEDRADLSHEFSVLCLQYLDSIQPDVKHVQMENRLLVIGDTFAKEIFSVQDPRTLWKVDGFDA